MCHPRIPHQYQENHSLSKTNSIEHEMKRSTSSQSRVSIRCIRQIPEADLEKDNDLFKARMKRRHLGQQNYVT